MGLKNEGDVRQGQVQVQEKREDFMVEKMHMGGGTIQKRGTIPKPGSPPRVRGSEGKT